MSIDTRDRLLTAHAAFNEVGGSLQQLGDSIIGQDAAMSALRNPNAFLWAVEIPLDFCDEIIQSAISFDLLSNMKKSFEVLAAVRNLHDAIGRQIEETIIPDGVVAAVVDIHADLRALIQRDILIKRNWPHPARKTIPDVKVHVTFQIRETVQAQLRPELLL